MDILLTGMLLTNVTLFAALVVFYLLILTESSAPAEEAERITRRSVLYLALFPTALFFFAASNTALILFLSLLCIYLLRRSHWWIAGCVGGLAALTDFTGIFLFIIFLCEYARQHSNLFLRSNSPSQDKDSTENKLSMKQHIMLYLPLLASLLIPLGLGVYAYGLYKPFHNFLVFLYPRLWSETPPPGALSTAIHALTSGSLFTYAALHTLFELLITLGLLVLLGLALYSPRLLGKRQWPLVLFGGLVIVWGLLYAHQPGTFPSQYDPFPAIQYEALLCFPAFMVLARLGERSWVNTTYLVGSTALLTFLVFQMFTGRWAM
jgi:cytochrome b561